MTDDSFKESYNQFIGNDDETLKKLEARRDTRFHDLQALIQYFGMDGYCAVHPELLWWALMDYFKEIEYLKKRHNHTYTQIEKIYAYELFWYLRNHVIQITDSKKQMQDQLTREFPNRLFVNEYILSFWVMNSICTDMMRDIAFHIQHDAFLKIDNFVDCFGNDETIVSFREKLFYTFRCRTYTQESLLLILEAFKTGVEFMYNSHRI